MADVDTQIFSKSEVEALDFAYNQFGGLPAPSLVDLTHRYPEWSKFKGTLESRETTREQMSYSDFFNNPGNSSSEDKFALAGDMLAASKELFEEDYKTAEYWR